MSHTFNEYAIGKSMTMQAPLQCAYGNARTPGSLLDRWISSRQQLPHLIFKTLYELFFIHQNRLSLDHSGSTGWN